MKISTRTRYGMRALFEIAKNYPERLTSIRKVSELQDLSPKYLEHIMAVLKSAGIVKVVCGARGGYKLARDPGEIFAIEVFEALEGKLVLVECVENPETCDKSKGCPIKSLWGGLAGEMRRFLSGISLTDITENFPMI